MKATKYLIILYPTATQNFSLLSTTTTYIFLYLILNQLELICALFHKSSITDFNSELIACYYSCLLSFIGVASIAASSIHYALPLPLAALLKTRQVTYLFYSLSFLKLNSVKNIYFHYFLSDLRSDQYSYQIKFSSIISTFYLSDLSSVIKLISTINQFFI